MRNVTIALVLAIVGCKQGNPYDKKDPGPPEPAKMLGQDPDKFDCTKVLSEQEVATAAGEPVKMHDTSMPPEPGEAKPCAYRSTLPPAGDAGTVHEWQISFDCRDRGDEHKAIVDAERYMKQYLADPDAQAKEIPGIGKRALDHQDIRMIVEDDDTTCAIYVVGHGFDARTALAKLVVSRLNETNMPRRVRAVRVDPKK